MGNYRRMYFIYYFFMMMNITSIVGQVPGVIQNTAVTPEVRSAAKFATDTINIHNRQQQLVGQRWYTLIDINNPTVQTVNGWVYRMEIVLTQSNCLNMDINKGASVGQCPPVKGGLARTCSVKVELQPWTFGYRLQNFSCVNKPLQSAGNQGSSVIEIAQSPQNAFSGGLATLATELPQQPPHIVEAANFATDTINAQNRQKYDLNGKWYTLTDIQNPREVVDGSMITMQIVIVQSTCLNTDSSKRATVAHCPPTKGGTVKICSVAVWHQPWRFGYRLQSSNCNIQQTVLVGNQISPAIGAQHRTTETQEIRAAANIAVDTINIQNRQQTTSDNKWYTLTGINNPTVQVVSGSMYRMELVLSQSACPNIDSNKGATATTCPPVNGGTTKSCSVVVSHVPWSTKYKLESSKCRNLQQQPGSQGRPLTDGLQTNPVTPEVRSAAHFASDSINNQNRQQTAGQRWYTLTDIKNPKTQVVNGWLYRMDIVLSQSGCSNVDGNKGATLTKCPPLNGGIVFICSVEVWQAPRASRLTLRKSSCVNKHTSQTGSQVQAQVRNSGQNPQTGNQGRPLTGGIQITPVTPEVRSAARFAADLINNQNRQQRTAGQRWYTLTDITNPTIQAKNGWLYKMDIVLSQSGCPNVDVHRGATITRCPPLNRGEIVSCSVEVWWQFQNSKHSLINSNCVNRRTAKTGNQIPSQNAQLRNLGNVMAGSHGPQIGNSVSLLVGSQNPQIGNQQSLVTGSQNPQIGNQGSLTVGSQNPQIGNQGSLMVGSQNSQIVNQQSIGAGSQNRQIGNQGSLTVGSQIPQIGNQGSLMVGSQNPQIAHGSANQEAVVVGGVQRSPVTPEIRAAATFAADSINIQNRQQQKVGQRWYTLTDINNPTVQTVNGVIYKMDVVLKQSACLNIDSNKGATVTACPAVKGGSPKTCSVEVLHRPWEFKIGYRLLTSNCGSAKTSGSAVMLSAMNMPPASNSQSTPINSRLPINPPTASFGARLLGSMERTQETPEVRAAADFAADTMNNNRRQKSSASKWYTLTAIVNPMVQTISGWIYKMDLVLNKSDCPNTDSNKGATVTQCPPVNGGGRAVCSVQVWHQPWTFGYNLDSINCNSH